MAILLSSCSDEQGNGTTTIRELSGGSDGSGYTLTISSTNGTVTKSPNKTSYNAGDSVTLVAVPANGYKFNGWSGNAIGDSLIVLIAMNSNKNVTATFEPLKQSTPAITFNGGIISPGSDSILIAQNDPNSILSSLKVTASDPVYGNLTNALTFIGDFSTSICSTYVRTYTVTNPAGNTVHKPLYIVVDCSPPELTVLGDNPMSLAMGKAYVEPGATATDNIDGTISSKIVITGTVNVTQVGSDTVTYTVSDRAGNKTVVQRVVNVFKAQVVDSIAPVITLNGVNPMNVALNGIYSEPGATATDNIDGPISSSKIIITGAVTTTVPGSYSVIYRVSDNAGNQATKTRTVIVSGGVIPGDSLPVITLNPPNPDTILVGSTYQDPGGTVTDKKDGNIPFSSVTITGVTGKPVTVVTTLPGVTYTLVYNVKDKAGNAANPVTRTVVVRN
jgi:hypothetical protein